MAYLFQNTESCWSLCRQNCEAIWLKWGTVVHLGAARGALVVKRYTDKLILSELVYSGVFNDLFGLLRRSSPNGGSHNRLHQWSYICPNSHLARAQSLFYLIVESSHTICSIWLLSLVKSCTWPSGSTRGSRTTVFAKSYKPGWHNSSTMTQKYSEARNLWHQPSKECVPMASRDVPTEDGGDIEDTQISWKFCHAQRHRASMDGKMLRQVQHLFCNG